MAYQAVNINPLDLKPSTAIGVAIPFSAPNVFTSVYTTQEQLKYNIINYLLTNKGERLFQPNFGANIRNQLFEQITPEGADEVEGTIRAGVEAYFPTVVIQDLQVVPYSDTNSINISFTYSITNTGQSDQISLNFENGQ
jgi:phage baseplate assembly protein W